MELSKTNNFDAIRLFAALQVLILHAISHLNIAQEDYFTLSVIANTLKFFPGVPIFFTISGFLIMWSYDRNKKSLLKFYMNRLVRIYPALWVCLLFTCILLLSFDVISFSQLASKEMGAWFTSQATFFQFYTPELLRNFGVGTPNGSLWTISIELQFYLLVPLLYFLIWKIRNTYVAFFYIIGILVISVTIYSFANQLEAESILKKLMGVFVLPYLYNFAFGILIYKYWDKLKILVEGKGLYWLFFYLVYSVLCSIYLEWYTTSYWPNAWGWIANLILAFTVISIAYTATSFSHTLLKGNDFSYGIYIYHMLVINVFVQLNYTKTIEYLAGVLVITFLLAVGSWFLIERPALKLKSYW